MNDMNTTPLATQHRRCRAIDPLHEQYSKGNNGNANEKREKSERKKKLVERRENEIHNTSQETKKQKTISSTCNCDVTLQHVGEFSPFPLL